MADGDAVIFAENGAVIEVGGIYLSLHALAKVISFGGPGGSAPFVRVSPDLTPVVSPTLWVKLCSRPQTEPAKGWLAGTRRRRHRMVQITVDVLLAWGPPEFPIRVGTEAVTAIELAARGEEGWIRADGRPWSSG